MSSQFNRYKLFRIFTHKILSLLMKAKNINDIPKSYNPHEIEDKWYKFWEENNLFHSEIDASKSPYSIVIPPPNITGMLTLGHILNNSIQDIYIRYKRMKGFNSCWVPGTDHASIATEAKVVKHLKDLGIDKYEIGREEFLKHCWQWKEKYGGIIIKQLRKLGVSCDWQRERFTMDSHYYRKVIETFVKLYNEGLIYRGYRMVNWDPASKSAISDEEVIYREVKGSLWYFRYPVKDSSEFLVVATTRPETMLGDTGVAVNPKDERYKHLVGKKVLLPLVNKEIPIFADDYVDLEFGTGAVKVTPAHDINDYEMAMRNNLEVLNIFNEDASTNKNVPIEFQNKDRYIVRKLVVEKLTEAGFVEKIEDYTNNVGYSERGGVPIEPYLSEQWFMKMDDLAKPALEAVQQGKVKFHPEHWVKTYEHWMSNIKDWCISRQLWWGHRIPVWYCIGDDQCKIECKEPIVSVDPPEKCPHCGSKNLRQDEDVLDTWASSWLWAQDVFTNEADQKYYYPTDLLVTGPDIIFFWVARMIMAGLKFMGDVPFKDVYFTSIIRDMQGRKMSKSLGNSPDPLKVINDYGTDALRFTINYIAPAGQDVLFSTDKCELGRNFANKIWNAARFLLMNAQNIPLNENLSNSHQDIVDSWIYSRFNKTIRDLENSLDRFDLFGATKVLYAFIWNDFCDWYIELSKNKLYKESEEVKSATLTRAIKLFENIMKILHPFMPFITEEIWQMLDDRNHGASISSAEFPMYSNEMVNNEAEKNVEFIQSIITAIRNIRGEMNIPPSTSINVILKTSEITEQLAVYIKALTKIDTLTIQSEIIKPKNSASAVVKGCEIFIPLEGLIDIELEKSRLKKEIDRLQNLLQSIEKKLSNKDFVSRAPAEIVNKEKNKMEDWKSSISKLKLLLGDLESN